MSISAVNFELHVGAVDQRTENPEVAMVYMGARSCKKCNSVLSTQGNWGRNNVAGLDHDIDTCAKCETENMVKIKGSNKEYWEVVGYVKGWVYGGMGQRKEFSTRRLADSFCTCGAPRDRIVVKMENMNGVYVGSLNGDQNISGVAFDYFCEQNYPAIFNSVVNSLCSLFKVESSTKKNLEPHLLQFCEKTLNMQGEGVKKQVIDCMTRSNIAGAIQSIVDAIRPIVESLMGSIVREHASVATTAAAPAATTDEESSRLLSRHMEFQPDEVAIEDLIPMGFQRNSIIGAMHEHRSNDVHVLADLLSRRNYYDRHPAAAAAAAAVSRSIPETAAVALER